MSARMIKFPSIEQYRNIVHNVTSRAHYVGKDANGDAMYDTTLPIPTLSFNGTVKLHGTNASIACGMNGPMWCQSRENIITPEKDNAGFAMHVKANEKVYSDMLVEAQRIKELSDADSMLIFGEWCGGNIQKNVAISQLPKMFVVFGIARVDSEGDKEWFTEKQIWDVFQDAFGANEQKDYFYRPIPNLYHIYEFDSYTIEIDFARPHDSQNKLADLTLAVEQECPVGKKLGATAEKGKMTGEGIVWKCTTPTYEDSGNWFKVKGDEHAAKSKVKTLAAVDVQRIDDINALAETVTPAWRLEQILQSTFDTLNGGVVDIKRTGEYIKNVMADVLKEELDTIAASGFTTKDITGAVGKLAREHLLANLPFAALGT